MVRWSRLAAAQCLPKTAVEGAEAPQVGYELPVVGEREEAFNIERETKDKTWANVNMTHTHQRGEEQRDKLSYGESRRETKKETQRRMHR